MPQEFQGYPLTEESISKVHETVIRVIEEIGFEVNSEAALELFERAGARVNREGRRVRLSRKKALELIKMAPSSSLTGWGASHTSVRRFGQGILSTTGG